MEKHCQSAAAYGSNLLPQCGNVAGDCVGWAPSGAQGLPGASLMGTMGEAGT